MQESTFRAGIAKRFVEGAYDARAAAGKGFGKSFFYEGLLDDAERLRVEVNKSRKAHEQLTPEQAFDDYREHTAEGQCLWQAMKAAAGADWTPPAPVVEQLSHGAAYDQLVAKAQERLEAVNKALRPGEKRMTKEQAFAEVYEDPSNSELVAQCQIEERRKRGEILPEPKKQSTGDVKDADDTDLIDDEQCAKFKRKLDKRVRKALKKRPLSTEAQARREALIRLATDARPGSARHRYAVRALRYHMAMAA